MKARHLGVREVARRARLDPSFFSKVLAGKRSPPSDDRMLERLALCLEMSPTALYVYAGRIPPACQAVFESPHTLAALEAGVLPEAWRHHVVAHPVARPTSSLNAWAASSPVARPLGRDGSRAKARATSPRATSATLTDDLL